MAKKRVGGKVRVDELVSAVMGELDDFGGYVTDTAIKEAVRKTSEEAVKELKSTSPRRPGSGKYASEWTSDPEGRPKRDQYTEIVYNDQRYRLTHLLEKGHRKRGGNGRVEAIPHIGPVEEGLGEKIEKFLREEVSKW